MNAPAPASASAHGTEKRRARRIYDKLEELYPDAKCALLHSDPWELLVATILSAQCTDARVNMVTPALFKRFPTVQAMADAKVRDIEELVKSTGFFRNKAKNIHASANVIVEKHSGQVPDTMEQLLELPGVARKTANVVLGNAFGKNVGVVVDTHIQRLSQRLGFTSHKDPKKIEQDLMTLFPRATWTDLSHLIIHHGRAICSARKPLCDQCPLARSCPKIGVAK